MIIEITIKDDNGIVWYTNTGENRKAEIPIDWKCAYGSPIIIERGGNNGAYMLHGFVYQPRATLNLQWRKPL